jgi:phosphomannomutase
MMTASHMPLQNNGLKFFVAEGGLGKADITRILDAAAEECVAHHVELGEPQGWWWCC